MLNPGTPISHIEENIELLDFVLIMSVNPGFGGQAFIPSSLDKIKRVRALAEQYNKSIRIAVDGGVKLDNIKQVADAGADTFVMGSAVFDQEDRAAVVAEALKILS